MNCARSGIWLVAVLAAATFAASRAQEPEQSELLAPGVPKYRVEFILFAHADVNPGEETFTAPDALSPSAELPPAIPGGGRAAEPSSADPAPEPEPDDDPFDFIDPFGRLAGADDGREPFRFRVLRADELELGEAYSRIDGLSAYRMLAHGGWEQDGLDDSAAQPMNLANLGITNPKGTLRLHLSRFLHLSIDLEYQSAEDSPDSAAFPDEGTLAELALRPEFRMVEQRRIARSGELHYVDHPLFGLVFKVSPAVGAREEIKDDTGDLTPAA